MSGHTASTSCEQIDTYQLLQTVKHLEDEQPILRDLEHALGIGVGYGGAWYASQKEHWIVWLTEYSTAGPYNRQPSLDTPAKTVYNRLMCPPMAFWLPMAVGVHQEHLRVAYDAALNANTNCASRTAAIRTHLPWKTACRHIAIKQD